MSFNFYYVVIILGVFLAIAVGLCCVPSKQEKELGLDTGSDKGRIGLRITFAAILGISVCGLVYAESWCGLEELFVSLTAEGLEVIAGYMCVFVAPIMASALYGYGLFKLSGCFAELDYDKLAQCAQKIEHTMKRIARRALRLLCLQQAKAEQLKKNYAEAEEQIREAELEQLTDGKEKDAEHHPIRQLKYYSRKTGWVDCVAIDLGDGYKLLSKEPEMRKQQVH